MESLTIGKAYGPTALLHFGSNAGRNVRQRAKREKRKRVAFYEARVARMLDNVKQIRSTEQVPIVCTVDKFMTEVKPVHNYTPSGRITARMMDEVRKIKWSSAYIRVTCPPLRQTT